MGRLLVGAAVGVGSEQGLERVKSLVKAGVDLVVIDTAHGHTKNVLDTLKQIKKTTLIFLLLLEMLLPLRQPKI